MTTAVAAKPFDPVKYKEMTHEQWQTAAPAWNDRSPLLRIGLGPATKIMLEMEKIGPGHRVLGVAAGAHDQALQTAERVGPNGDVLATDISANILDFAAQNARAAGHRGIGTKVPSLHPHDRARATIDVDRACRNNSGTGRVRDLAKLWKSENHDDLCACGRNGERARGARPSGR